MRAPPRYGSDVFFSVNNDLFIISRFGGYLIAGLSRKQITVNGITYAYYERLPVGGVKREDAPAVLFLHGFTADKSMWTVTVRYLPKEWWIIILDLPGHGDTSFVQNGDYSPIGMVTKLDEVGPKVCVI